MLFLKLNPSSSQEAIPNSVFRKYLHIRRNGKTIGYFGSRQKTTAPCVVMPEWDRNLFGPPLTAVADPFHPASKFRPVKIHHFAKLSIQVREHAQVQYLVVAHVSWYFPHPDQNKLGKPAQVWCRNMFERYGLHSYLPVDKIMSRCVYCVRRIQNESVMIVVPLIE